MAILVFVAAAIGLTVLAESALKKDQRMSDNALLASVHRAIVGDPAEEQFGYLGDVGDYPAALADLMKAPAGVTGWNGPYLSEALFSGTTIYDSYGSQLEYFLNLSPGALDELAIISAGPDHGSANSGDNTWAGFTVPYPSAGAPYFAASGNADNAAYPDFSSNANAVDYEDVGHMNYLITNYNNDPFLNAVVPACPLLYNIVATSDTRGATDTITVPYVPASPMYSNDPAQITGFLQGFYRMAITSPIMKDPLFSESVANYAGRTRTRTVRGAHINSNTTTPQFHQYVKNNSGVTIDIYRWATRIFNDLTSTGVATDMGTFRVCAAMVAVRNSDNAVLDLWVQPWGTDSTHVVGSTYNTLTVTNTGGGGAAARRYLIVYEDGIPLGIVYRRKTVTFSHIPNGASIVVTDQTGGAVAGGTFTMGAAPDTRTF